MILPPPASESAPGSGCDAVAPDHPDLIQLPGGSWIARRAPPCGCCGAAVFDVARVRRKGRAAEAVEVRCPTCPLLTDKHVAAKALIGTFDTRTGTLTLDPGETIP